MTYYIICTNHPESKQPICMMGTDTIYERALCVCEAHNKWFEHKGSPARCTVIKDIEDE